MELQVLRQNPELRRFITREKPFQLAIRRKTATTVDASLVDEEKVRVSVMRMVTRYAERGPYRLNPDRVVVDNIIAGLVKNKIRYGYAYCPCREVSGIPRRDKDNICPCRSRHEDIARDGTCECGLYVSTNPPAQ